MRLFIVFYFFSCALWSSALLAMPKSFEIWFLSPETRRTQLWLDKIESPLRLRGLFAMNNLQCQPMGDYCFDPQAGLYKMGDKDKIQQAADYSSVDSLEDYSDKRKALGKEREKADCSKGGFFELFCNEGKGAKKVSAKLELWIDTSSTMKQVDFAGYDDKMCQRESFLRLLSQECSFNQEMQVYAFNEVKKQLGKMDAVCLNSGLNNRDKIIRDIKISKAKHLIVVTDIYEADETLINFVESSGVGSVKGLKDPMFAADLKAQVKPLQKKCL